jgi:hypothetical protein
MAEIGEVLRVGFLDTDMRRRLHAQLVRLVEHGLEHVAIHPEQLESVCALLLDGPDAFPNRLRRGPSQPGGRVDEDARRGDLVRGTLGAPLDRLGEIGPDVADGCHAGRQIEIHLVLERLRNPAAFVLQVHVRVDESRQHVLARGVDDRIGRRVARGCAADSGDEAVLHQDVNRPICGFPVAVDHHRIPNEEAFGWLGVNRRLDRPRCSRACLAGETTRRSPRPDADRYQARHRDDESTHDRVPPARLTEQQWPTPG